MEKIRNISPSLSIFNLQDSKEDVLWSAWERFEKVTGYEHDLLSDKEYQIATVVRSRKHLDYSIPAFITGLKMKYSREAIQNFLFKRFGINVLVDSMRRRTVSCDGENLYDVHLWADEGDYLKVLLWEEIHPDFVVRKHAVREIPAGIRDYFAILPRRYLNFVKQQLDYTNVADNPSGASLDSLLKKYCETLGLAMSGE